MMDTFQPKSNDTVSRPGSAKAPPPHPKINPRTIDISSGNGCRGSGSGCGVTVVIQQSAKCGWLQDRYCIACRRQRYVLGRRPALQRGVLSLCSSWGFYCNLVRAVTLSPSQPHTTGSLGPSDLQTCATPPSERALLPTLWPERSRRRASPRGGKLRGSSWPPGLYEE